MNAAIVRKTSTDDAPRFPCLHGGSRKYWLLIFLLPYFAFHPVAETSTDPAPRIFPKKAQAEQTGRKPGSPIDCALKSYWHNGRQSPFYYYRDKDKREIDILIVRDGTVYPIEIKRIPEFGSIAAVALRYLPSAEEWMTLELASG